MHFYMVSNEARRVKSLGQWGHWKRIIKKKKSKIIYNNVCIHVYYAIYDVTISLFNLLLSNMTR